MKQCSKCKQEKPLLEFYKRKDSKDGHNGVCRECIKTYRYKYRYGDKFTKAVLDYNLRKKYDFTLAEYDELFIKQNGVCAICKQKQPVKFHRLAVDHNHQTGKVRGLLCQSCNGMLGLAKDSVNILVDAIKYLTTAS